LEFAKTPPDVFVKKYLIKKIGMKKILIGFDHMFGKDREGNEGLLNKMSKEFDFEIEKVGPLLKEGIKVSSSKIREDIAEHYIKEVNEMLGYDFFIKGKVVLGDGRGKTIGFPTANIDVPEHKQLPANGIYLIKASFNNRRLLGLANIGTRPTFTDDKEVVLEVYLFDFNEDIYGEVLKIEFLDFLRQEEKFDSADSLLFQIEKDIVKAKEMLHSQQSPVNSR